MAVGMAPGSKDYTFDGTSKYIPLLFASKTLEKFYDYTFMTEISHTDYVGAVANVGDKVIIRTVPDTEIRDYVKNQKLEVDQYESAPIEFTIDHAKYFNFTLDDIDIKQMDLPLMDKWSADSAQQMKIAIERHILGNIYADAHASNKGTTAGAISADINLGTAGTPVILTKTNIIDYIVDLGLVLDEQNMPETERFLILPAWATAMIKKSDLKDTSMTGDPTSPIRNGKIGMIDRFTVYNSNLLTKVTADVAYHSIFGHKMALAFVSQLTKTEMYRPQDTFANAMKGLNVYGFKVLQTVALGDFYIKKG